MPTPSGSPGPTYQTIHLSKGKHRSPAHGACVMELASMLAGEAFSDRPASVCRVLGGFLRTYNDAVDEEHRQSLYAYAAQAVGTRATPETEHARAVRCTEWGAALQRARPRVLRWLGLGGRCVPALGERLGCEAAGVYAARAVARRRDPDAHAMALAFIEELLSIGADDAAAEPVPAAWQAVDAQRPAALSGV